MQEKTPHFERTEVFVKFLIPIGIFPGFVCCLIVWFDT